VQTEQKEKARGHGGGVQALGGEKCLLEVQDGGDGAGSEGLEKETTH